MSDLSPAPRAVSQVLVVCGYVFAFLLPLIGLVIGVVLIGKGAQPHGWVVTAISVLMIAVALGTLI